jgi:hypothetical protein
VTRRLLLLISAAAVIVALGGGLTGLAYAEVPSLSQHGAKYYAGQALHKRFDGSWDYGIGRHVRCDHRKSRTRVRCRPVSWAIGDASYKGWVTIWFGQEHGVTYWYYAMRIKRLDEYCRYVQHHSRSRCTRVIRVR